MDSEFQNLILIQNRLTGLIYKTYKQNKIYSRATFVYI